MRTVRIRLLWHKQPQFAGYLVAEALGLGRARGLEILCAGLDFSAPHVNAVLLGLADFAVASPSHVLECADPAALSVVAVIQQTSPLVYPVRAASPIRTLGDLAGRRIAVWPGNENLELAWMLHRAGVPAGGFERVEAGDTVAALVAGEVDAAQMTSYHELHHAEAALGAANLRLFRPEPGVEDLVKDGLVASRRMIAEEPEIVQAALDAVLEGWTIAFDDPERAVAICRAARPDMGEDEHRAQLADIRALAMTGATLTRGLGYPDPAHGARAARAMAELGHPVGDAGSHVCDTRFWSAVPPAFRRKDWT